MYIVCIVYIVYIVCIVYVCCIMYITRPPQLHPIYPPPIYIYIYLHTDGQTLGMKLHPFLLKALQMPPPPDTGNDPKKTAKPPPSLSDAAKKRLAKKKKESGSGSEAGLQEGFTSWKYDLEDLKETEPDFYRGLQWIRDCDDVEGMYIYIYMCVIVF